MSHISDEQADKFVEALRKKTERDQEPKTIVLSKTDRGFSWGNFTDLYGAQCAISKSSLATDDAIWLGVLVNMSGQQVEHGRMHLNVQMVQALLPLLTEFAATGELSNVNKGFFCSNCCESFVVSPEHPVKFCAICGDEFDVVVPDEKEDVSADQLSCPSCSQEFAIYDTVGYRMTIGMLWCPYCGYGFCEAQP